MSLIKLRDTLYKGDQGLRRREWPHDEEAKFEADTHNEPTDPDKLQFWQLWNIENWRTCVKDLVSLLLMLEKDYEYGFPAMDEKYWQYLAILLPEYVCDMKDTNSWKDTDCWAKKPMGRPLKQFQSFIRNKFLARIGVYANKNRTDCGDGLWNFCYYALNFVC